MVTIGELSNTLGNNTNVLTLLRELSNQRSQLLDTFNSLSTGLRKGSSGNLISAGLLDAQIQTIQQSLDTTQTSINFINTADSALGQVNDLLVQLKSVSVKANDSTLSVDARNALQSQADQILDQINRIQSTSTFGSTSIFGSLFLTADVSSGIDEIDISQIGGILPETFTVDVTEAAEKAEATGQIAAVQSADVTFTITGQQGTQQFTFEAGTTREDIVEAINDVTDLTGVEATSTGTIQSEFVGSNQSVTIQFNSGQLEGVTAGTTTGTDVVASFDGVQVEGQGNTAVITTPGFSGTVTLKEGQTGTFSFTVVAGGITAQVGSTPGDVVRFQVPLVSTLGKTSESGQTIFSLSGPGGLTDPDAQNIIDSAISEVNSGRSQLGSFNSGLLQTNVNNLEQLILSLSGAKSSLTDADIALEITDMVRQRLANDITLNLLGKAQNSQSFILNLLS